MPYPGEAALISDFYFSHGPWKRQALRSGGDAPVQLFFSIRNLSGGARLPCSAAYISVLGSTHGFVCSDRHEDSSLAGCHAVTGGGLGRCGRLWHEVAGCVTLDNAEL